MSAPAIPSPARETEVNPSRGSPVNPPDPLLNLGSFIDPARSAYGVHTPKNPKSDGAARTPKSAEPPKAEFPPGVVIAAEPISVFIPAEKDSAEAKQGSNKRWDFSKMSERPEWLPTDWTFSLVTRTRGGSAGLIDPYYYDPTGTYKFRSKIEVEHFKKTGQKLIRTGNKRKSPGQRRQQKSNPKPRKSRAKSNPTSNPMPPTV